MGWNATRMLLAERLWREGFSARQIADRLDCGLTRNAVIGKAHRMNWQRGVEPLEPPPPPPVVVAPPPPPPPPLPVVALEPWMCRHEIDQPGRFGIYLCCKTVQPGRHYCAEHLTASQKDREYENRGKLAVYSGHVPA